MSKIKKFTITCAIIFVICLVAILVMLPFCVNDLIDTYNDIVSENIEFTYNKMTLQKEVENIYIFNSAYVEVRKSKDNLVHVETLNAGIINFSVKDYYFDEQNKAEIEIDQTGNGIINRDNIIKFIKWNTNYVPEVIIYVPENVKITTAWARIRNPYTGGLYPTDNSTQIHEVIDKSSLIIEINNLKNNLESYNNRLIEGRRNLPSFIENGGDVSYYYDNIYSDILNERLNLVKLVYRYNNDDEMLDKYNEMAYTLTASQQNIDVSNLKMAVAKVKDDRSTYEKIRKEENEKIERNKKIVNDLQPKFEDFINLIFEDETFEEIAESSSQPTDISDEIVESSSEEQSDDSSENSESSSNK